MAPILTFTAEELWQFLPEKPYPTVQVADWPVVTPQWEDRELGERWETLLRVRGEVTPVLERYRREKLIGGSLEAVVELWADDSLYPLLDRYREQLDTILIVPGYRSTGDWRRRRRRR